MVLWYGLCTLVIGLGLRCRRPKTRRSLSNRVTGGELISAQRNSRLAFVITSQLGCKSIAHLFHAAIISNFFIFILFNHPWINIQSFYTCIEKCWSLQWLQKLKNQMWVRYYNITTFFFTASDYGILFSSRHFEQKSTQTSWLQFAQIAYLANMAL